MNPTKCTLRAMLCASLLLSAPTISVADIHFDNSAVVLPSLRGGQLSGNAMIIRADYGKLIGQNLFHSFAQFNINAGQSATFTPDGVNGAITNIIGRVTGNSMSTINGLLKSSISNANLYLLNPNGIVFGKQAQIDIKGAFHASTAKTLNFSDGNQFNTINTENELLTQAPVQDFGFLENSANNNGTITINGAQLIHSDTSGTKTLDLVAGSINIKNTANIDLPAGEIRLVARQNAGTVSLLTAADGALTLPSELPTADNSGSISIENSPENNPLKIETSGNGAGRMALWGGDIHLKNAWLFNDNNGSNPALATQGKTTLINAKQLTLNNTQITTDALNLGNAPNITLQADDIHLEENSFIQSKTNNQGDGGNITLIANTASVVGSHIKSAADDTGNAGNISLTIQKELSIDGLSNQDENFGIQSIATNAGNAGNIAIHASGVNLIKAGVIESTTNNKGDAGNIELALANYLMIDGLNKDNLSINPTRVFSGNNNYNDNIGKSGTVTIKPLYNTDKLGITMRNGGIIATTTYTNETKTGDILINADTLIIENDTSKSSDAQTGINSSTYQTTGSAGDIEINVRKLLLTNEGQILAESHGQVNAGKTTINATESVTLNNESEVSSSTFAGGEGGTIIINSPNLSLNHYSSIGASSSTANKSGDIVIHSRLFKLLDNSFISALNKGINNNQGNNAGDAGAISITADDAIMMAGNSKINVTSAGKNAGDISLGAVNTLYLLNSEITTSAAAGSGNGGNIVVGDIANTPRFLNPRFSVLNNSALVANAKEGNGGKIDVLTRYFLQSTDSIVDASSKSGGIQGIVSVRSANANIAGSIALLNATFADNAKLAQAECNKHYSQSSSFVVHYSTLILPSPHHRFDYLPSGLQECHAAF